MGRKETVTALGEPSHVTLIPARVAPEQVCNISQLRYRGQVELLWSSDVFISFHYNLRK